MRAYPCSWPRIVPIALSLLFSSSAVGCGDDSAGSGTIEKVIGPDGGRLTSADGVLTVEIPAGALSKAVALTIDTAADPTDEAIGAVYELGPDGQRFDQSATLSFKVQQMQTDRLTVATLDDDAWLELASIVRGKSNVSGETTHFSRFALVPTDAVTRGVRDASTADSGDVADASSRDASADAAVEDAGGPDAGASTTIARTLVYHQITTGTESITDVAVISADGSRIAFPIAPGTGSPDTPNRIYAVNADGTGLQQVDSYTSLCFCGSKVAISADGSTIVSTDSTQIRVVSAAGSLIGSLVLNSNEISDIALANDGADVFFIARRDAAVVATAAPLERGVWTMTADGTGLRQVAGPTAVADLLGSTPADVFPFNGCGPSLGVSADGSRIAFAVEVAMQGGVILGGDGDGTVLHVIVGPIGALQTAGPGVRHTGISSDGSTVFYEVGNTPGLVDPTEIGTIAFDGSGKRPITTSPPTPIGSCFTPFSITANGGSLLLGDTGVLFPTDGGDPLSLALTGGFFSNDPLQLVQNGNALSMTMTDDGSRFVYRIRDPGGVVQAVTLDVDPMSLGGAPNVSNPEITPDSIPRDRSSAVLSADVTASGTALRVSSAVLLRGLEDTAGSWISGAQVLTDDGENGDSIAGDDTYTTDAISAGDGATVGPRIVRVKAEVTAGGGVRHATAVDIEPFAVR